MNAVSPDPEPPSGLDEETRRLAALQALEVLDTPPEPVFDAIAASAAEACAAPVALVCLVDARRQWFKAAVGLPGASGTPREFSFCDHAIRGPALFEVADASADPRFAGNPFVTGAPGLRFYAGAPIVLPGGERIGTVCVLDRVPRRLDAHQRTMLECLARIAASTLSQRRALLETTRRLSESEAHYRAIVEDQSELISIARPDGTLTFVNDAFARHFGLSVAAMTGRSLYDFVDAEDLPAVRAHLEATLRGTVPVSGVNRMRSAEGARRWVAWTNRPVIDAEGRTTALQSVGRDVTEQRLAEERLAAAKRRVRRLYEATPAIMHSIDAEGRLIDVSDRWLELMGYRREEVIGRLSRDFLTPASQAHARDVVLPEFFRLGSCDRVAYQFIRSDGKLLDVLLSATLERDAQGAPVRSLAVLEDVTAQKRLEAELGRTHAHLDAVVDNMPALVGYWDAQGVTRFANRDFQAAVGQPIDAIIGCTLAEIIAAIDQRGYDELAPRVDAVLAGKRQEFECAMLTTSGLRQLHVALVPAQAEAGRVDGFYGTWFDITGMKTLALRQRESEQRYRALVEHLGSGYALHAIEVDDEGTPVDYRFLALNPAFCTLFGIEAANAIGARATEVFPLLASDPADWIRGFGHVAMTGETLHVEQRFAASRRWLDVIAYRTEPGQFAVIAQDITERKRLEADLARLRS